MAGMERNRKLPACSKPRSPSFIRVPTYLTTPEPNDKSQHKPGGEKSHLPPTILARGYPNDQNGQRRNGQSEPVASSDLPHDAVT